MTDIPLIWTISPPQTLPHGVEPVRCSTSREEPYLAKGDRRAPPLPEANLDNLVEVGIWNELGEH